MKTLTQVVLPIAAIVALVFGITFVANYSPSDPAGKEKAKHIATPEIALKFPIMLGRNDPAHPLLRNWKSNYEIEEHGHFDFWFQNAHEQEVRIAFTGASCQCAGADLGIVPDDAWAYHLTRIGAVGVAALTISPVVAALDLARLPPLEAKIQWQFLAADTRRADGKVPAALSPARPQMGIVRLNWTGKEPPEQKRISADFVTQLPNQNANALHLEAMFVVAPPFYVSVGGSRDPFVRLGDLGPRSTAAREIICWSRTRTQMNVVVTPVDAGQFKDCVEVSEPRPLSDDEREAFARRMSDPAAGPVEVRSAYSVKIAVHERREVQKVMKQLDLGPFDFQVQIAAGTAKPLFVPVSGVVRGDIRIVGAEESDRIDFGTSFPSSESRTQQVRLVSEVRGLDLELIRAECTPDYLVPSLKLKSETDGRKDWILSVTIPASKLFGQMYGGSIVLQTKGAQDRKFRIPVKASAYQR